MKIRFTKHAREKFKILARHGIKITQDEVLKTINEPDKIDRKSRHPQIIFQRRYDHRHVMRIICRQENDTIVIITFYPGRIS